jgi:hypothetical protein
MSISVTGMPALAKLMAMPPPMVPAPITAAFFTSRTGVSSGTSGILAVWRSAKNIWRSAFDSSPATSCAKRARSCLRPSSNGRVAAASAQATISSGAG